MSPSEYAIAVDGSEAACARRIGLPQTTFNSICRGEGCNAKNALIIILGSHARPAPNGQIVTLEEIVGLSPEEAAQIRQRAA